MMISNEKGNKTLRAVKWEDFPDAKQKNQRIVWSYPRSSTVLSLKWDCVFHKTLCMPMNIFELYCVIVPAENLRAVCNVS